MKTKFNPFNENGYLKRILGDKVFCAFKKIFDFCGVPNESKFLNQNFEWVTESDPIFTDSPAYGIGSDDISKWDTVADNAWSKIGNAGANPTINFLGTTDNNDLVFRTNNTEKFRITGTGRLSVSRSSIYIGNTAGNETSTSWGNVGVGNLCLVNVTSGYNNVAMGTWALQGLTTGERNTAVGFAPICIGNGSYNVGIGYEAGRSTNANSNVTIGYRNLYSNSIGAGNVCIGFQAGYLINSGNNTIVGNSTGQGITTGSNNTIIGAGVVGLPSTLSNNIILADGSGNQRLRIFDSGNTSIGTTTDAGFKLDVNGNTRIQGKLNLKNYTVATLPTPIRGDTCYVTDALAPVIGSAAVGGGAIVAMVWYNGTAWTITGI